MTVLWNTTEFAAHHVTEKLNCGHRTSLVKILNSDQ